MPEKYLFETARLKFREFAAADATWLFQLNNDPEVIKYTGDLPFKSVQHAGEFLRQYSHYRESGYGRWVVIGKRDKEVLGWCGLRYVASMGTTDIGFRFLREHWGQGFATEAAAGCLQYGFEQLGLQRIIGRCMALNKASVRVLEKLGMRQLGAMVFEEHPGLLFEMKKEDWLPEQLKL